MSYLEKILREICFDLNKEYAEVEKYQKILESEWIVNKEAINSFGDDEFFQLGIPKMLVKKLRQKANQHQLFKSKRHSHSF